MMGFAPALATAGPALFLGFSGLALLGTRSWLSGVLMVVSAAALLTSAAMQLSGFESTAHVLLVSTLLLPAALAIMAYPRARFRSAVDFCTWMVVGGAGVIGASFALNFEIATTLASISSIALIVHGWSVIESAEDEDREAMLWLILAFLTIGSIYSLVGLEFGGNGLVGGSVLLCGLGPALVIGVRWPRLADVRSLIVQAVVFGVIGLTYMSIFIAIVAGLENGGDNRSPGIYAFTGLLLAAGFHPLRVILRGLIDEILFGDRPDPLVAATAVADQIGDDPLAALRAIRTALVLPYARITAGGVELASSGTEVTETRRLPLALGNNQMGEITVGLRPGDLALSKGDEQVLRIVAPLLAQTLRARQLAHDLAQSRTAAITAIAEERRRLRRDLHDGLGPTLSGIAFTADAARNTITADPSGSDELLRRLRADAVAAVGEIRQLVYAMRPPALDELGLVQALQQQVASMRTPQGQAMQVNLVADDLPPLPAAVEVAAFRIATEAVLNSARHSGTDQARIQIEFREERLELSIQDGGSGKGEWVPGVGLVSMRERAVEVGGALHVSANGNGSLVKAILPVS